MHCFHLGGNTHIASIWGVDSATYMQTIHFGFSSGGFIGPQVAKPFLAEVACVYSNVTSNNVSTIASCTDVYGESHVHWAYLITGIATLTTAVPFIIFTCMANKYNTYVDSPPEAVAGGKEEIKQLPVMSLKLTLVFVALLMFLVGLHASTESRFSGYITTFNDDYLQWSKQTGMDLASVYWAAFAGGRFFAIPISHFLSPENMIAAYFVLLVVSTTAFLLAAVYHIWWLIWLCCALIGFGVAPIFPAVFTWTARSIMAVTGKVSAAYLVGPSLMNAVTPLLYGYLMENVSYMYFCYLQLAVVAMTSSVYLVVRLMVRALLKTKYELNTRL